MAALYITRGEVGSWNLEPDPNFPASAWWALGGWPAEYQNSDMSKIPRSQDPTWASRHSLHTIWPTLKPVSQFPVYKFTLAIDEYVHYTIQNYTIFGTAKLEQLRVNRRVRQAGSTIIHPWTILDNIGQLYRMISQFTIHNSQFIHDSF
ncbi:unnamed protein product [Ambrosiozyma monospora]|uniref:Unnamed protein product n=1 Tax=Ambrosiozyma monospora TaxID=43982 RepID=A0A9W6Z075_AMBMO|nr:unnamed protein product [Ambrosiozyma monospora]